MSYYAHSEQSDFYVRHENFTKVLEALRAKYPEYENKDDLPEVITEFGLTVVVNESGHISETYCEEKKLYIDEIETIFAILAPFVAPGSYITFRDENDNAWAYYFDGSGYKEYSGETVFPGMPMEGPERQKQQFSELEQGGHYVS